MPPCGICQTWVLSTCSGPSTRRPMKTLPSRLNTARPAQGRYGKDSNGGMEWATRSTQDTREYRIVLREIQVVRTLVPPISSSYSVCSNLLKELEITKRH